jgi:biotin carboxyl carrier protein
MELALEIDGRSVHLSTDDRTIPGTLRLEVDGDELTAEVVEVDAEAVWLRVAGELVRVATVAAPEGIWCCAGGRVRLVAEASARRRRAESAGQERMVTPPFPSTVSRLLVAVGDSVAEGQPLVVVSAMKTELTLSSPRRGVVRAIRCEVGASVGPGDILVEIDDGPKEVAGG